MSPKRRIVGVMGGGQAQPKDIEAAYKLGALIAQEEWILLNGGRNTGVMEASARGAWDQGGLTVGILPDADDSRISKYIGIPIITGMGNARNCINVLSSHVIVACPGGAGTLSEIALGLKSGVPVILLNSQIKKPFDAFVSQGLLHYALTPKEAIAIIKRIFST